MSSILIKNIGVLYGVDEIAHISAKGAEMAQISAIENAFLHIENTTIHAYGPLMDCPASSGFDEIIDAKGGLVFSAWCDSHTHIVFARSREEEFVDKINGLSYEAIAARGGGILNSARRVEQASEDELYSLAYDRLVDLMELGTGAIEIKSGYGLSFDAELKMLRVIQRLKKDAIIPVKATFLGAHALPAAYKTDRNAYIDLIVEEMLPAIASAKLADYCDVFCERGFFTPDETTHIIRAAKNYGLKPKIHANQLDYSGGVQVGVAEGAISVDHLEHCGETEIAALAGSSTIPTLLPACAFFLRLPMPPARQLIEAGLPVAIASDFNPGSSPTGNMNLVMAMSCIQMRMLPEEALAAGTINGAAAMELSHVVGSIAKGKRANVIVTKKVPSLAYLPYAFGTNHLSTVILNGKVFKKWQ